MKIVCFTENLKMASIGSAVEKKEKVDPPKSTVDRESTCPLLLRVFCSTSRHNNMSEYMKGSLVLNTYENWLILIILGNYFAGV